MELELKLHEIMVNFGNFWNMHCGVNLTRYFQSMLQQILKICWNEKERVSKNDLKKVLCRVPPYLALGKDGFAECPLSQHSTNNLFAFFFEKWLCRVPDLGHSANLIRHSANPQRLIQIGASLTHTPHTHTHPSTVARPPAATLSEP